MSTAAAKKNRKVVFITIVHDVIIMSRQIQASNTVQLPVKIMLTVTLVDGMAG